MANKEIGEVDVDLGGVEYTLRPSFTALCEIEARAGMGLLKIAALIASQDITVKTIASVIYGGVMGHKGKGQPMPFSFDDLGEKIMEQGVMKFVPPVMVFLAGAMTGRHPDGEKKTQPNP